VNEHDVSINVFAHFSGSPEVSAPEGFKVNKLPAPKEPELEPIEALVAMEPGELTELRVRRGDGKRRLVLASHGRKANLVGKREMIAAARAANRQIEVHVFDKPSDGS
jgi:hypothetical protein